MIVLNFIFSKNRFLNYEGLLIFDKEMTSTIEDLIIENFMDCQDKV